MKSIDNNFIDLTPGDDIDVDERTGIHQFTNAVMPTSLLRVESSSALRHISPHIFIRLQALTHRGCGLAVP
jgi:hypothetical protein